MELIETLTAELKAGGLNIRKTHMIKPVFPFGVIYNQVTTSGANGHAQLVMDEDIFIEWCTENATDGGMQKIADVLNRHGLDFYKQTVWLSTEKMYQTTFTVNVVHKS